MKKTKIFSLCMAIIMLLTATVFIIPANAADVSSSKWEDEDNAAKSFNSGTGTSSDPYIITNAAELAYLSKWSNGDSYATNKYFKVVADEPIDMSAHLWTKPIRNGFEGVFDGNGCTVKGLTLGGSYTNYCGMFAKLAGASVVKNLNLEAIIKDPTGAINIGAIAGRITAAAKIQNCNVTVDIDISSCTEGCTWFIGGVVGAIVPSSASQIPSIENTVVYGSIDVNSIGVGGNTAHIGGIAGAISAEAANTVCTVSGCDNYANLNFKKTNGVAPCGGIIGIVSSYYSKSFEGATVNVTGCTNYGSVCSDTSEGVSRAGGIVGDFGRLFDNGTNKWRTHLNITNCVNIGSVTTPNGSSKAYGAMVGYLEGKKLTVNNCFSADNLNAFGWNEDNKTDVTEANGFVNNVSLKTLTGARVRIDTSADATSGIRFDSGILKTKYDEIAGLTDVTVSVGTIIAPTKNIVAAVATGNYDIKAALDAIDTADGNSANNGNYYTDVAYDVAAIDWLNELVKGEAGYATESNYYFSGAIGKIKAENYMRDFSAVAYFTVTKGDWSFTFYADSGVEGDAMAGDRTRSVGFVGNAAYNDSPAGYYTQAQMAVLKVYNDAYVAATQGN